MDEQIVVTHFAPLSESLPSICLQCRVSDPESERLDPWAHSRVKRLSNWSLPGHCNSRGKPGRNRRDSDVPYENLNLSPSLVIEV
jgi:hypothetical protein